MLKALYVCSPTGHSKPMFLKTYRAAAKKGHIPLAFCQDLSLPIVG